MYLTGRLTQSSSESIASSKLKHYFLLGLDAVSRQESGQRDLSAGEHVPPPSPRRPCAINCPPFCADLNGNLKLPTPSSCQSFRTQVLRPWRICKERLVYSANFCCCCFGKVEYIVSFYFLIAVVRPNNYEVYPRPPSPAVTTITERIWWRGGGGEGVSLCVRHRLLRLVMHFEAAKNQPQY